MASKVNTRFVIIVVLCFGAALALLGGVYVLKLRGDATRSYNKGLAALEQGNNDAAHDQFARALNKDPGNPEYLKRVEETLLKKVPATINDARELYGLYMSVLGHGVLHNPKSAETHLRLINELYSNARRINFPRYWEMLLAGAENMDQQLPDGDPQKPLARVYRAIAMARLSAVHSDDTLALALKDLDQAASALGDNDLACATQINFRSSLIDKMRVSGKSRTSIEAQEDELTKAYERSLERAPNGPETARAAFMYLLMQRFGDTPNPALTDQQLRDAAQRVVSLLTTQSDPGLVSEVAGLLELVPEDGLAMAAALMERQLEANPQQFDYRLFLTRMYYRQREVDRAEVAARQVIDSKQLPVSFLSEIQFDLRRQAASLLCDVEYHRWQAAGESDRPAQLEKLLAARELLAGLVADPAADMLLMRADGKIAYAREDFAEAAQKFERLTRQVDEKDPETLSFAAASLAQVGQLGLAHERLTKALASSPTYVPWLVTKADLELKMGRTEDASHTIEAIPDSALSDPRTKQVVASVRQAAGGSSAPTDDPVQAAINAANEALLKNEVDNARAVLLAALEDHPQGIQLYQGLAQVELNSDNREKAREYVTRGLQISPDDELLKQLEAGLRYDDPIKATLEYQKTLFKDPKQRLQTTMMSMAAFSDQQRRRGQQLEQGGDSEGAKKASDLAERADVEAQKASEELAALDPEDRRLLDYRFMIALKAQQWDQAVQLASTAKRLDADGAGGMLYQGRLELARANYSEAISALEVATDRLSFSSSAWRLLAIAYQSSGNFAQAERAYQQAYRCNPNDIEGARAYLTLLNRRGDKTGALQILESVHRMAPQDVALREAWLDLQADVGDKAAALRERTKLYKSNPDDQDNAAALARLLVSLEPSREVILDDRGQLMFTEARWGALSSGEQEQERTRARQRWQKASDEIIAALSKAMGDDLRVAVLQATAQRERGDLLAGENTLKDFIARRDKSKQTEDMYVELGRYQAAINHYNDAIESLRQAVALAGPQQLEARVNLGLMLMQFRLYDEALENLEAVLAKRDDQTTRLQAIECLIRLKRFDEAETRLKEATSGAGGSVTTLLAASIAEGRALDAVSKNDLAAADRHLVQQRELLGKAEQQDPTNPMPRVLLARSLLEEFYRTKRAALLDDALTALDRADQIRAGTMEVCVMRVAVLKGKGDLTAAIGELRRALELNPDNAIVRRDLIQSLLESKDQRAALDALDAAIAANPTLAVWHEMRGDLLRNTPQLPLAVASYNRAYEIAPSTPMLLKLTGLLLDPKVADCKAAADRLAARAEDMKTEAVLRETYARALACLSQHAEAVAQLRLAYATRADAIKQGGEPVKIRDWFFALLEVFPFDRAAEAEQVVMELTGSKPDIYGLNGLARVWIRTGDAGLSRATELQRQAIVLCDPKDERLRAELNNELGGFLVLANDLQGAAECYEIVIRLQPGNVNAMNNLAYIYAEDLNKPSAALPLADRLAQLAPQDGAVLDTVGWVYFKNGNLPKAKEHLERAVAILPLADSYIHLATVLHKMGETALAEKSLAEAEKLKPSPSAQQRIKALRDDIEKSRRSGG